MLPAESKVNRPKIDKTFPSHLIRNIIRHIPYGHFPCIETLRELSWLSEKSNLRNGTIPEGLWSEFLLSHFAFNLIILRIIFLLHTINNKLEIMLKVTRFHRVESGRKVGHSLLKASHNFVQTINLVLFNVYIMHTYALLPSWYYFCISILSFPPTCAPPQKQQCLLKYWNNFKHLMAISP